MPRYAVPVFGTALSADRRELIVTTAPRTAAQNFALMLPDFTGTSAPPRVPEIDLASDLNGVEAEWKGADGTTWRGWLPHPELAVSRALTAASAEHAKFFALLAKPGQLRLRGQLDLWQMLHPAVQPGAKLDYEPAVEKVTVSFTTHPMWKEQREAHEGGWLAFDVSFATGPGEPEPALTWTTADDPRPRAFPLRRILLPWAKPGIAPAAPEGEREVPEIAGGNWLNGKKLFAGKATCGTCHVVRGEGGHVGPDLSNLVARDYASVLRDIREPSAALNPDYPAYSFEPKDGAAFMAVLLGEERGEIRFADATGAQRTIARAALKALEALPVSLMPPGLLDTLTPAEQRDLLTFLLIPPLEPAPIQAPNPPPPRKRAEIEAVLRQSKIENRESKISTPFRIVLCAGPKDHGPGEHDYPLWQKRWSRLLAMADGVEVSTAWIWPTAEQWQSADVVAFFSNNPGWNAARALELDAFLARGKGVAYFHWAVDGHDAADLLAERIGLASVQSQTKYRHGAVDFTLHPHPLAAGFQSLHLVDETYWGLQGDESRLQLLASAPEEGAERPQLWTREQGGGRVFVSIPGHYNWTFDDPLFRILALRGLCWAGGQPMDRLAELATIGARMAE